MRPLLGLVVILSLACASTGEGDIDSGGGGGGDAGDGGGPPGPDSAVPVEICDGVDNDGDQFIDEGDPEVICGVIANATPRCNGIGGCRIESCDPGFGDVDNLFNTGCECEFEATENGSGTCDGYIDLGNLADTAVTMEVNGKIAPVGDVDYYRFLAVDNADTSCDAFHVRARLLDDAAGEFELEVWRGGCAGTQICMGSTDFQWYTNYQAPGTPPTGQCPCGEANGSVNQCVDETAEYVVRVSRRVGMPLNCTSYRLEISNGAFSP